MEGLKSTKITKRDSAMGFLLDILWVFIEKLLLTAPPEQFLSLSPFLFLTELFFYKIPTIRPMKKLLFKLIFPA